MAANHCQLNFYPGYSYVGRLVKSATGLAADYALLVVSLAASALFLFWWTGPTLTERLGVTTTYLALVLLNMFTTGFALVTIQTEPLTLLCVLGAFLCLRRRWFLAGAALAGLAGAMRVTGGPIGAAYGVALLAHAFFDTKDSVRTRVLRVVAGAPLCGWAQLLLFWFFNHRFNDPLLYTHAHAETYGHSVKLLNALWPAPATVARSLTGFHEGIWLALALLWLALGLREALSYFAPVERAYWAALLVLVGGTSILGSAGNSFSGMNRYLLIMLPLFFSMAVVLRRRPTALVLWLAFSFWHYWNVDECIYIAERTTPTFCNMVSTP